MLFSLRATQWCNGDTSRPEEFSKNIKNFYSKVSTSTLIHEVNFSNLSPQKLPKTLDWKGGCLKIMKDPGKLLERLLNFAET